MATFEKQPQENLYLEILDKAQLYGFLSVLEWIMEILAYMLKIDSLEL